MLARFINFIRNTQANWERHVLSDAGCNLADPVNKFIWDRVKQQAYFAAWAYTHIYFVWLAKLLWIQFHYRWHHDERLHEYFFSVWNFDPKKGKGFVIGRAWIDSEDVLIERNRLERIEKKAQNA